MRHAQVAPGAETSRSLSKQVRQSLAARRWQHAIMIGIGLAAVAHLPRDSHSQQHAIMLVIGLAAVAGIGRDNQARLAAWDKRRNLRYLRTVKARA